jgi:hypothetical protein
MHNSRIEVNKETGRKSLLAFYDNRKDDFDQQIEVAMAYHGVSDGEMVIITMPELWRNNGDSEC